jgi:hypothetical protein
MNGLIENGLIEGLGSTAPGRERQLRQQQEAATMQMQHEMVKQTAKQIAAMHRALGVLAEEVLPADRTSYLLLIEGPREQLRQLYKQAGIPSTEAVED